MTDMPGRTITYHQGAWHEGNPPMVGPMVHSLWMASAVFDGARAFNGLVPDLDRHCARVVTSAESFGMKPDFTAAEIEALVWEGLEKFDAGAELYIRPLYYFADGFVTAKHLQQDGSGQSLVPWDLLEAQLLDQPVRGDPVLLRLGIGQLGGRGHGAIR